VASGDADAAGLKGQDCGDPGQRGDRGGAVPVFVTDDGIVGMLDDQVHIGG
jgi:hypothetical protein